MDKIPCIECGHGKVEHTRRFKGEKGHYSMNGTYCPCPKHRIR